MRLTDDQIDRIKPMSQQERMATFGKLMGERKVTWQEYAFIVKQIPYSAANQEDHQDSTDDGKQQKNNIRPEHIPNSGRNDTRTPITQDAFVTGLERIDTGAFPRLAHEGAGVDGGEHDQEENDAFEEKLGKIRENILSG